MRNSPTRPEYWIRVASEAFSIDRDTLLAPHHGGLTMISKYRNAAMWVARAMTGASFPRLASAFNRMDHTTIINGVRRAESDEETAEMVEEIFEHVETSVYALS